MKKLLAPAWIIAWARGILPDWLFFAGKKTPWYRRSLPASLTWVAPVLIAPFAIFLAWKAMGMLRTRSQTSGQ